VVQTLKISSPNPNPRGEEGGRARTGRGLREEHSSSVLASGERKTGSPKSQGVRGLFFFF
jgi:hypothetical protein